MNQRLLPGFRLSLSFTLLYLILLLMLPLAACIVTAAKLGPSEFLAATWTPRAFSAYRVTFGCAAIAAGINVVVGTIIAWTLVRYQFPGRLMVDALVDLPLALPTAVAGLVYSSLYVETGWLGQFLVPIGVKGAYSPLAIVLVLVFVGLPFVVRTVQPVLEELDVEIEEAAESLGANRYQTFRRVLLPQLFPAIAAGFAMAFARGLGEYGSVVFVSGNMPFKTEIAPVLIVASLEAYETSQAAAIAVVLLVFSLASLALVNLLQLRLRRTHG